MNVLVTGGVRSGKSRHAEHLLSSCPVVTYVAPGPTIADDPDWTERIRIHQARRPPSWRTLETCDLAAALQTTTPLLVDCLGTWLTALLDKCALWDSPAAEVHDVVDRKLQPVLDALASRDDAVLVTNEVGWGVVPAHRSGRVFQDQLGLVNQRVATVCGEVHLVVAGRVLVLS